MPKCYMEKQYIVRDLCCPKCPPGKMISEDCTEQRITTCTICPIGLGLKVKKSCSSTSDAVCEVLDGFFCSDSNRAAELLHPSAFSPDSEDVMEEDGGVESEGNEGNSKGRSRTAFCSPGQPPERLCTSVGLKHPAPGRRPPGTSCSLGAVPLGPPAPRAPSPWDLLLPGGRPDSDLEDDVDAADTSTQTPTTADPSYQSHGVKSMERGGFTSRVRSVVVMVKQRELHGRLEETCTVVVETVEQSTQPSRIGARVIPTHEQTHCRSKVKGVTPERTSALEGTSPLCFPITVMDPKSRKGLASEWGCRYGAPQTLHSDQGRNFESECVSQWTWYPACRRTLNQLPQPLSMSSTFESDWSWRTKSTEMLSESLWNVQRDNMTRTAATKAN
ncbi:unnamed protein product [Gadus morhua 'NCC']